MANRPSHGCCSPPSTRPTPGPRAFTPAPTAAIRSTQRSTPAFGRGLAEIWINPEVDQGFGLSNTFGVAGYPSGEAFKLGKVDPYVLIQRGFLRQTIDLGGEKEKLEPDLNQLGGLQTADRVVLTVGKYSVVDIFDTNKYAPIRATTF